MKLKLNVEIVDTDSQSIADVMETITQQIRNGMLKGFDHKTVDETECSYTFKISQIE